MRARHTSTTHARSSTPVDEGALSDGSLSALPYRIGWFAPLAGSSLEGRGRCGHEALRWLAAAATDVPVARIDARAAADAIDWNANGNLSDAGLSLDVNSPDAWRARAHRLSDRTTGPTSR